MRFFKGVACGILVLSLLWITLIALQTGRPTLSSQWIADAYNYKTKIAQNSKSKKLVIVAGSNALFGIDSSMLEETYHIPTVNFGVNAGLLLPYVLLKSKTVLKKGDIVLMPLEYHFYVYDGTPNIQMIDQIWSRDPSFFWQLSFTEQIKMLWMTPLLRVVEGFLAKGGEPTMMGPYGFQNLDSHGDQTHTSQEEAKQWKYDWDALKKDLPRKYGVDAKNKEGWNWLKDYVSWAKEEGICLIVMPPTMMYLPYYKDNSIEKEFYTTLNKRVNALGIHFISEPYAYMYDRENYFNTDYHLNNDSRKIWTKKLIKDLGPNLLQYCNVF